MTLNTKASLKNLGDLRDEMKVLATKEDYQNVKDQTVKFETALNKFKMDMSMFGQIIRRYDEVLSEKASKVNILQMEDTMHTQLKRIDVVDKVE